MINTSDLLGFSNLVVILLMDWRSVINWQTKRVSAAFTLVAGLSALAGLQVLKFNLTL